MTLRSLPARLAGILLVLLALAGALSLYTTLVTTELYLEEVNQSMNLDLARNIARLKGGLLLTEDGGIQSDGIGELLHWMMVVNPGPQFYLLDLEGNVLAYDPMAGGVELERVDLDPVHDFLDYQRAVEDPSQDRPAMTIVGDDPRDPDRRKVFSASPIPPQGPPGGYLYIVLASHHLDSVPGRLRSSYILRLSTRNALAYLAVVLLSGFLAFGFLTRPLRRLAARMRGFRDQRSGVPGSEPAATTGSVLGDEVQLLDRTFDEMTRRIQRQLAEIERMSGLHRELIANVSHDLRTPIASLQGYLDTLVLKADTVSEEEREQYLEIALEQSERLGKLVDELFELTKLDAREVEPSMERFRITELVQDNVQRFQLPASRKGVRLSADFDPDLPPVVADIGLMERALENLIENALRFTPEGGSVTVELREAADRLMIRVIDTGCGIPEEDLPRIFDRYYRSRFNAATASPTRGAGLGLAITRRILELHGSEIEVESRLGEGTTFSFALALASPRPPAAADYQVA